MVGGYHSFIARYLDLILVGVLGFNHDFPLLKDRIFFKKNKIILVKITSKRFLFHM
jgi:hypothetical protein